MGCLSPVYKEGEEEEGRPQGAHPWGGILLLLGVGSPFPSPTRRGRKEEGERRKEGGAAPPPALSGQSVVAPPPAPTLPVDPLLLRGAFDAPVYGAPAYR